MATQPLITPAITVRGRIDGLDGLRGFATLVVTLVHLHLINKVGWVALQSFFVMSTGPSESSGPSAFGAPTVSGTASGTPGLGLPAKVKVAL